VIRNAAAAALGLLALIIVLSSWYTIESGNVGVERTLGSVGLDEVSAGLNWKLPLVTSVTEYSAKEIPIDFEDLKPKAGDNLSLLDLDVSIFYRAAQGQIAELAVKYAAAAERGEDGAWMPAYGLVFREARSAIYEQVVTFDSLDLHRQREALQSAVEADLRGRLEEADPGVFTITRVVVRALNTDPSIEESIRQAVANQKVLEAKEVQVRIAEQDAQIRIREAQGIAEANRIINESLTAEYLQHEVNAALQAFADSGGSVVVIPANMQGFDLILDAERLRRQASNRD
jgi:regulator of protease activity HflC (stomatin/prohibitin superfamily)